METSSSEIEILYVEDDRDSREMLANLVKYSRDEYRVTTVTTAAEALDLIGKRVFDLYILDIWLPGMDGMSLCRRLRERGIQAPIIFYSAMVKPEDREFGLAAGANEFLVKPGDIERLLTSIDRFVGQTA